MRNKCNKKWIIALIAASAVVVGIAVAIGAYLKKHAAFLNETLDYDDELFYDEDEDELEYDAIADPPIDSSEDDTFENDDEELPL